MYNIIRGISLFVQILTCMVYCIVSIQAISTKKMEGNLENAFWMYDSQQITVVR
jgi:hypothetical protein